MIAVSYAVLAFALRAYGGSSTGLIPLTELPPGLYQGFEGGLYPGELNSPPAAHLTAGLERATFVQPRDTMGDPDPNGWIVMLSIGMSNTTHEFAPFERQEDLNVNRNARLLIINGAHGGQTASAIRNPSATFWTWVDERLTAIGASRAQVQVVWLKEANANPPDNFPTHATVLSRDLRAVVQVLKDRFVNLELCYLSSRIYGGYATGGLNPEPQAYESAFAVKWLIEDQINGAADLNFDPNVSMVEAPWLGWGPYLWADGLSPRGDGLIWQQSDLEGDGTHPSPSGEQKAANLLSGFFGTDPTTQSWYMSSSDTTLRSVDATVDAHVLQAQPSQNFGMLSQLQIAGGATPANVFVKFDVSAVSEPILFAKLSFRVVPGAQYAQVGRVNDDSWSEAGITWNNAPAVAGPPVVTTGMISRDGSISADVTQAVVNETDRIVSLRLSASGGNGAYLSRESGQPPRLILVVATAPAAPEIPAISGWGLAGMMVIVMTLGAVIVSRTGRHLQTLR